MIFNIKTKPILLPTLSVDKNGTKRYLLNGKLHRTDGPAAETPNGDKYWHQNGVLHRQDGPAVEYSNGYKYWWLNDELIGHEDLRCFTH